MVNPRTEMSELLEITNCRSRKIKIIMAIKPVQTENLTALQELCRKFWTKFNDVSAHNNDFVKEFKLHKIASIRYYQDYAVGKPYHICIKLNFAKEQASIQAYFNNMCVYDEFYNKHRHRIESMIGSRLAWKEMTTKGYAQLNLNVTYPISDISNWDDVCNEMIAQAILMKSVFAMF